MTDDTSTTPAWGRSAEDGDNLAALQAPTQIVASGQSPGPGGEHDDATVRDSFLGAQIGTYHVESVLGHGGFGTVYKATDTMLRRPVALKVLRNQLDTKHRQLFEREARAIASLRHPNIVQIHQWGEYLHHSFFALEFLPLSVADLIKSNREGIEWTRALPLVIQCADALSYAHNQGIIHRDIKPPNLLLESESGPIKLADFGLSRYSDSVDTTIAGTVSGSPPYMSPEQASAMPVDHRSDIFSLGVTLYEMLTGKRPFEGSTAGEIIRKIVENQGVPIRERRTDLPPEVLQAVEKALAHQRTDRYQSAADFARDLNNALPDASRLKIAPSAPVSPRKPTLPVRLKRWHLAAVVVAALVAVGGMWSMLTGGSSPSIALASGDRLLESGDAKGAQEAYIAALKESAESDAARYGLGFAYLRQGMLNEAAESFGNVDKTTLRTEGLTAVACEQVDRDQARAKVAEALANSKTAYLQTLLGALDVDATQYQQAADVLQSAQAGPFTYRWQEAECLQALGQAYFHLQKFNESAQVFESLRGLSPNHVDVADNYLRLAKNTLDDSRRQQVLKRAEEIRKLMESGIAPTALADEWTSRPMTYVILPAESNGSRVAAKSGMVDVLPMLVGDALAAGTPMSLVDRELIQDVLSEQQLSALLGSNTNQIQLGKVLGARLLMQFRFIRIDGKEMLRPYIVDTERTTPVATDMVTLTPDASLETTAQAVAHAIWSAVRKTYPLQGRLMARDGKAEINIGSEVGVTPGARFDVLMAPSQPALPNRVAIVEEPVAEKTATVQLENLTPDTIPPEGWYVRSELEAKQGGQ